MTVTMESVSVAPLSLEDRQAILQQQVVAHAAKGWRDAQMLYMSLLAPSMAERAMRDEAKSLREAAREA